MSWKDVANRSLSRTTGYELRRVQPRPPARPGNRLVPEPAFVMCTLRSGSTLLRLMLNSHPEIHCPHEIHLRYISVNFDEKVARRSMKEMGLDKERLEYLLWDRILHRELMRSGKPLLVTKTPNVSGADDLKASSGIAEGWFSPAGPSRRTGPSPWGAASGACVGATF